MAQKARALRKARDLDTALRRAENPQKILPRDVHVLIGDHRKAGLIQGEQADRLAQCSCPESNLVNDAAEAGPRDRNFESISESDVLILANHTRRFLSDEWRLPDSLKGGVAGAIEAHSDQPR